MTFNDPFNMTNQPSTPLLPATRAAIPDREMLDHCRVVIETSQDHLAALEIDAFNAALEMGQAVGTARDIAQGDFTAWFERHFGETSRRPISRQWALRCANAAEVVRKLEAKPQRAALLAKFNTIDKLCKLVGPLDSGEDLLAIANAQPAPTKGRPPKSAPKLKIDNRPLEDAPTVDLTQQARALDARAEALDRREKVLDAREKRLTEWEDDLTRRAALMTSSAKAHATDVAEKNPIDDLKAQKLAADAKATAKAQRSAGALVGKKAPADASPRAPEPRKAKVKGVVASTREIAPETVAAIQDAAARAVADTPETVREKAKDAAKIMGAIADLSAGGPVDVNEVL